LLRTGNTTASVRIFLSLTTDIHRFVAKAQQTPLNERDSLARRG
jgi:hypothetical protein